MEVLWCTVFILHSLNYIMWCVFSAKAIDSIHQVGLYCLALVPANTLPKTPLGGIHICETKQNFLEGNLHPCNILMCPHTCVTNLPKPRQKQPGIYWYYITSQQRKKYQECYMLLFWFVLLVSWLWCDVFDLSSGCRPCFYAGRQLGGRETDRPGYRQRAGCGGGPGSDPKGTICHIGPEPHCTLNNYQKLNNGCVMDSSFWVNFTTV